MGLTINLPRSLSKEFFHFALLALGVKAGDEVIAPALNFVADINTIMLVGATPVLADCTSLADWNFDPGDIERKITHKI